MLQGNIWYHKSVQTNLNSTQLYIKVAFLINIAKQFIFFSVLKKKLINVKYD